MVVLVCWCNGQQFVWWCWSVGVMVSSLYGGVGLLVGQFVWWCWSVGNGQQFVWWCWSVGVTVSSLYGGVGLLVSRSAVCMVVLVCWCNGQQFVWWCWSVDVTSHVTGDDRISS